MSKNIAIILSGGSGSRFGGDLPKQFSKLAGRAVIEYTIEAFEKHPMIDEIRVVSKEDFVELTWDLIKKNSWKKVSKVIIGGKERFDSTLSAIRSLSEVPSDAKVLFHDAVRPLVSSKIITDSLLALDSFEAVDVVVAATDTLVEVIDDGSIVNIPNRQMMRRGQTPQGFKLGTITKAYDEAIRKNKKVFTCDCGVIRSMLPQTRVTTVEGAESNLKITHSMDLFVVEKFIQSGFYEHQTRTKDLSKLKDLNVVVFGGTSGIGKAIVDLAIINGAKVYPASRKLNGVDVGSRSSVRKFLENLKLDKIDAVINTTGFLIKKPIDLLSDEEQQQFVSVNFVGAVNVATESKNYLSQSRGMLVNFTSSSYTRGRAYYALYSSTKSAVVNLTQALSEEWGELGIKVNCINPERTATPMRVSNFGIEDASLLLTAEEVAKASLGMILSDENGVVLDVRKDGR